MVRMCHESCEPYKLFWLAYMHGTSARLNNTPVSSKITPLIVHSWLMYLMVSLYFGSLAPTLYTVSRISLQLNFYLKTILFIIKDDYLYGDWASLKEKKKKNSNKSFLHASIVQCCSPIRGIIAGMCSVNMYTSIQ